MAFSNLCAVIDPTTRHSGPRTHRVDRITPHCWVGQVRVENGLRAFKTGNVSSNYIIGSDGRIGGCVDEDNRSWCSSSAANDHRAITIECASDIHTPYTFNDDVYNSLINLMTDICKRNGIKKLLWLETKEASLNYEPKTGEAVITLHRWFANKACPGDWLVSRMRMLADEVTGRLTKKEKSKEVKVMIEAPRLTYGSKGEAVKTVQALLKAKGYKGSNNKVLSIDGEFGANTQAAVNKYQETFCKPDGIVGQLTWTHLING